VERIAGSIAAERARCEPDQIDQRGPAPAQERLLQRSGHAESLQGAYGTPYEAQDADRVGTAFAPGFLVTAIMALATAWTAASPFGQSLDPDAATRPVALRESIAEAVRLISSAK
jgi:hypothetical protein